VKIEDRASKIEDRAVRSRPRCEIENRVVTIEDR
jgi:hypothetical protein